MELIALSGPLAILLFWPLVCSIFARLSGWSRLSHAMQSGSNRRERRFYFISAEFQSGSMPINYKNCLFVRVGDAGIRLSVLVLFRPFHPPLFIPWERVTSWHNREYLWGKGVQLLVNEVGICLWGWSGEAVRRHLAHAPSAQPPAGADGTKRAAAQR